MKYKIKISEKQLEEIMIQDLMKAYEDAKKCSEKYPEAFSNDHMKDVKALKRVAKYYGACIRE